MEDDLATAAKIATEAKTRVVVRELYALRGEWRISTGHWELAADALFQAVRMAREMGRADDAAEAHLALAKFYLGRLEDPVAFAEQLAGSRDPAAQLPIAKLWRAIREPDRAASHARAAYEWAWADGEPYVRRYALTESKKLLEMIGAKVPDLPPYDPAKHRAMPWEAAVANAVATLKAAPGLRPSR